MFDHAKLKVLWAQSMIEHLDQLVKKYHSNNPYELTTHHDLVSGDLHIKAGGPTEQVDFSIAIIAGDIAQQIRSVYDYVTSAIINTARATDTRIHFPIHENGDELAKTAAFKKILGFNADLASHILNEIKPTKTGNFPIWAVNKLANKDKHRNLLLASHVQGFVISDVELIGGVEMSAFYITLPAAGEGGQDSVLPGLIKYRDIEPISEICFNEPELRRPDVLDNLEIVKTLANFSHVAAETIDSIERLITSQS